MSSKSFLIRIEGVNFDATISDTNDLSTIRGGSLALLALDRAVRQAVPGSELVMSGASQALLRVEGHEVSADTVRAAVAACFAGGRVSSRVDPGGREPPFSELTVVVDVLPDADDAPSRLEAMNHARQLRQWTVAPVPFRRDDGNRADPFDGVRPATVAVRLPKGKVLSLDPDDDGGEVLLSPSVAARRAYGRRARQLFYRDQLPETWERRLKDADGKLLYSFTNSTEDIVAEPPKGLAPSLETKVAVVYADGNAFGALRDKVGAEVFSERIAALRRDLLGRILDWYRGSDSERAHSPFVIWDRSSQTYGLRLETLLWGGDEMMFVMPSWLAVAFVEGLLATTAGWSIGGVHPTHSIGVAVAHHKTPIRQMQVIAKAAADLAKEAGLRDLDTVTFDIFESLAPPDIALGAARARVFQTPDDEAGHLDLARSLALPGDTFSSIVRSIDAAKVGPQAVPRSQLYGALRSVRAVSAVGDYRSSGASDRVEGHFTAYARRMGLDAEIVLERIPAFGARGAHRPIAFDVAMTTVFWDYVRPLAASLPSFPAEA